MDVVGSVRYFRASLSSRSSTATPVEGRRQSKRIAPAKYAKGREKNLPANYANKRE